MFDPETFLTELSVLAAEFCKTQPVAIHPGRPAALWPSEVLTLAVFGQWAQFPSERACSRSADHHLRPAFPTRPCRPQLHRLLRLMAEIVFKERRKLGLELTQDRLIGGHNPERRLKILIRHGIDIV